LADDATQAAHDLRVALESARPASSDLAGPESLAVAGRADPRSARVDGALPEADASTLTATELRRALDTTGVMIVRNVIQRDRCRSLAEMCREAALARDVTLGYAPCSTETSELDLFEPDDERGRDRHGDRHIAKACEAIFVADWPPAARALIEVLAESSIIQVVADLLGEWPAFAFEKWVLRHIPTALVPSRVHDDFYPGWHQDGAVGWPEPSRAIDVWIAFESCGDDTGRRGLEVVPRPMRHVLPSLTVGALYFTILIELLELSPPCRPSLAPGDALIFDGHTVHRTGGGQNYSASRASADCWLFAPSSFPRDLTPLSFSTPRTQGGVAQVERRRIATGL
jgi:ectoine hydroxylase-related dioxygenase (phytanoyl-CoA dioxygenase family)